LRSDGSYCSQSTADLLSEDIPDGNGRIGIIFVADKVCDESDILSAKARSGIGAYELECLSMTSQSTPRFPSFWQLQAIGWGALYAWGLLGSISDLRSWSSAFRVNTLAMAFMFLNSIALRPVCRSLLRRSTDWLGFVLRTAVWSVAAGNLCALVIGCILDGIHNMVWSDFAANSMQFSLLLFMWCNLYFSIKHWQQSSHEKERLLRAESEVREARLRAESEVREARLRALRYQLNPHFLFNSLNAVSTLIRDENGPAATRMLAQIGDLLRSSLESEVTAEIELSQEVAFTKRYLEIERTRLGERMKFEVITPPETLDALVPNMLLQPLVENAVRYGVAPLIEGGRIAIESAILKDRLRIVIANSGRRKSEWQVKSGNGIGLSNTAERLKATYGSNQKFSMAWPEGGGCEVTVELPLRRNVHLQLVGIGLPNFQTIACGDAVAVINNDER
jgi:two-component system LytT family sensor kinase